MSSPTKKDWIHMKALLIHAVLLASLTGVAALFASAQATTDGTEVDKRAEKEVRRLSTPDSIQRLVSIDRAAAGGNSR
jgi:hypothetical protein